MSTRLVPRTPSSSLPARADRLPVRGGSPAPTPRVLDPWRGPWRAGTPGRSRPAARPEDAGLSGRPLVLGAARTVLPERPALRMLQNGVERLGTGVDEGSVLAVTRVVRLAAEAERWLTARGEAAGGQVRR
ncbi:MAG: hypothetical protein R3E98_07575 [Gemmatimonadota bacterium]